MSQDSFNRYTSGGGRPVNEMGSTTPGIEFSESERPAVGLLPAPYLPSLRFDEHKRANVVLSAGAPAGLDGLGNLVPAGIPGGHTFVYTSLDYRTGLAATKNAATGAVVAAAGNGIMHSGLTDNVTGKFIRPIGVVSYNVFQFEGETTGTWPTYALDHSNPLGYGVHNTMAQDLVAVTCDYVLQVPYLFGKNLLATNVKICDNTANEVAILSDNAKSFPFAHDELIANATVTQTLSGILSTPVAGSGALVNLEIVYVSPLCGQGDNGSSVDVGDTLIFTSGATGLAFSMGGTDAASAGTAVTFATLSAKGNYVLYTAETEKYVVLKNRNGGTALLSAGGTAYFNMGLGNQIKPSDGVVCRAGKFVKFDSTRHDADEVIGQCLRVDKSPAKKDYLGNVKTAYERSATVAHRMAGSATRGVPYLLHLVTDGAQVLFDSNKTLAGSALSSTGMTTPPLALVVINMLR